MIRPLTYLNLGCSDRNIVLLIQTLVHSLVKGSKVRVTIGLSSNVYRATFSTVSSAVKLETMFAMRSCKIFFSKCH